MGVAQQVRPTVYDAGERDAQTQERFLCAAVCEEMPDKGPRILQIDIVQRKGKKGFFLI